MQIIDPKITVQTAQSLGLTADEFGRIKQILNRTPNFLELYIFSVMWSEAISYKNSLLWLKTLPKEGKKVIVNKQTRSVDVGDGYECILQTTNDNSPVNQQQEPLITKGMESAIQELASIGATPLATLQSLKFGAFNQPELPTTIKRIATQIGKKSQTVNVPIIGGETYFHKSYDQQTIINTMTVGLLKSKQSSTATFHAADCSIFILSERKDLPTEDSISDETFNELENDSSSESEASTPLHPKTSILTKIQQIIEIGTTVSVKHIAAGGLTHALVSICKEQNSGVHLEVEKIPNYQTYEELGQLLCHAMGEQFILIAKNEGFEATSQLLNHLNFNICPIGMLTNTEYLEIYQEEEKIATIPIEMLVIGGGTPVYERAASRPKYLKEAHKYSIKKIKSPKKWLNAAEKLFSSPNLVSKSWVRQQYALTITTEVKSPADASLIAIPDSKRALALTQDGNPRYVYADPYVGGMIAVAEAARNIVCSGGKPIAISHGLNYGDPHNPEVYWQFVNAIKGITDACRKFKTPVISGDVSFYQQSIIDNSVMPILPSPTIGMLGLLEDVELQTGFGFKEAGDIIYMIGNAYNDLNSSEYLNVVHGIQHSPAPKFDLHEEFEIQQHIKNMIRDHLIESAHDVSEGGLFMCLMESAMERSLGFNIETVETFRKDAFLFGESQSRIVVSLSPDKEDALLNYLISNNVSFSRLGEIFGADIVIDNKKFGPVQKWKELYDNALSLVLDRED